MATNPSSSAIRRFRIALGLFIAALAISGLTAFPLLWEIDFLGRLTGAQPGTGASAAHRWIATVQAGLADTYASYPWIAYGTDWLAFAHLVIALFFIAPIMDPLSSRSNLKAGLAACIGVIPLAVIAGEVRGVPLGWRMIDCSFGVFGFGLLYYCWRLLPQIEADDVAATKQRR